MGYLYKEGKKRIQEILDNEINVKEGTIPKETDFTFENGYYGWVTSVFVDIRDSSSIFSLNNKEHTSKMVRVFTSEVSEILRENSLLREIGIRGDCVYAIYASPNQKDIYDIYTLTVTINTLIKMLNKMLKQKGIDPIRVGIGMASAQELVVKAGRKNTGINNLVWIGDAVSAASNLSNLGDKEGRNRLVYSSVVYSNIFEYIKNNDLNDQASWFKKDTVGYKTIYHADIIISAFNDWIEEGMIE